MKTVALLGVPATGKTTIAREVIKTLGEGKPFQSGLLRGHEVPGGYILGIYNGGTFDGTDRLSMAVQKDAIQFISHMSGFPGFVFFEGDRLATSGFLGACEGAGELKIFFLQASGRAVAARHARRGDNQTETFLKGRTTKVAKLYSIFGGEVLSNETEQDLRSSAERISKALKGNHE